MNNIICSNLDCMYLYIKNMYINIYFVLLLYFYVENEYRNG